MIEQQGLKRIDASFKAISTRRSAVVAAFYTKLLADAHTAAWRNALTSVLTMMLTETESA